MESTNTPTSPSNSSQGLFPTQAECPSENRHVTILAGPTQAPFVVSTHILEAHDFFRALLSDRWGHQRSKAISVDCEADVFQNVLRLMQYGSFAALPPNLRPDELFRLQQEINFFGISIPDFPQLKGSSPILDPSRLALVTWQASSYKEISCQCNIRYEARWLVSLFHCYIFCSQCRHSVILPEDLLLKVLAVAEGVKWQSKMLPEAPMNKYRNGILSCVSVSHGLVQVGGMEGWSCTNCSSSSPSFAVCLEPFHAFCTECHNAVYGKVGVPKSHSLLGKLWLMAVSVSRKGEEGREGASIESMDPGA